MSDHSAEVIERIRAGESHVEQYPSQTPDSPLVSVIVCTYNQRRFIGQCLDSILEQRAEFPFEVIVGEDESDDGTREICVDYARKHQSKIRLMLHSRLNVIDFDGRPSGRYNFLYNLLQARGTYVAFCEGDDYWTDPTKLQRQVDVLEAHPDCAICFHRVHLLGERGAEEIVMSREQPAVTTTVDLARENYIHTCSCVFRSSGVFPDYLLRVPAADYALHLFNAQHGRIRYLDRCMAVYRQHGQSRWSSRSQDVQRRALISQLDHLVDSFDTATNRELRLQRLRVALSLEGGDAADVQRRVGLEDAELLLSLCQEQHHELLMRRAVQTGATCDAAYVSRWIPIRVLLRALAYKVARRFGLRT